MTPSDLDHFEDRLLEELRAVVVATPAPSAKPRGGRQLRVALAGACCAAAVAATALVIGSGGSASKAYAIEPQPDGVVVVSIDSPVLPGDAGEDLLEYGEQLNGFNPGDDAGLQSGLEEAGIPAVVDFEPTDQQHCLEPAQEDGGQGAATNYGSIGWDGLNRFWRDLRNKGGVAWAELPPFPKEESESLSHLYEALSGAPNAPHETPGLVARDGHGVTLEINPSRIGSGEKLYILASDGTMETVTMSVSGQPPVADCPAL